MTSSTEHLDRVTPELRERAVTPWPPSRLMRNASSALLLSLALAVASCEGEDASVAEAVEQAKAPSWVQPNAEGATTLPEEVKGTWLFMTTDETPKSVSVGSAMMQGEFGYSDLNFTNLKAVEGAPGPIPTAWQGIWFSEKRGSEILLVSSSTLFGPFGYSDKHYSFLEGSYENGVVTVTAGLQGENRVTGSIEVLDGVMVVSMNEVNSYGSDAVGGKFSRKGHDGPTTQGRIFRVVDGVAGGDKAYGTIEVVGEDLMLSMVTQNDYRVAAYGGMVTKRKKDAYVQAFGGKLFDSKSLAEDKLFHAGSFDVRAVIGLLKKGKYKDLSGLEKVINDTKSGINNVDLDKDGKVDFIGIDESKEGKTVVLRFMAFPSSTPDDKASKTLVSEVSIAPDGKAMTETKTADGKVIKAPSKMIVTGQYPEYAQGHERAYYDEGWNTSDTALLGGGLLLGYLLTRNRPMYGGYGYNHYRGLGYGPFYPVAGPSMFYNQNRRFLSDNDLEYEDEMRRRNKKRTKRKLKAQKSKLTKKHNKKVAKLKKARKAEARRARSRSRSVRNSSRSRGSRRGK